MVADRLVCLCYYVTLQSTVEELSCVETSDWPFVSKTKGRKKSKVCLTRHKFSALSPKKTYTFTLEHDCCPFTCKSTQIPHPLPFHNIMEPVETWDNIWRGNGKDNGRLWTTFIPSRSPLSCVWVAAALLNHVWNF